MLILCFPAWSVTSVLSASLSVWTLPVDVVLLPHGAGSVAPVKVSTSECLPVLIDFERVQPIDSSFVVAVEVAARYGFELR